MTTSLLVEGQGPCVGGFMYEVGIRELKSRLSHYVQLVGAGETIAVKVRGRLVGFLSDQQPVPERDLPGRRSRRNLKKMIEQWKQEGFLLRGGIYHHRPFKPVFLTPGLTTTEIIREMRDEN